MQDKTDVETAEADAPYTAFSNLQKSIMILIVSCTAAISAFASNIYFPAIPTVAKDLDTSTELINLTVTVYMIFQGLSPPLWAALSDAKGRRISYGSTLLIFVAACIPLCLTRSYTERLVLRCLQSAGSASTIAIGSGVIGDITKREDRGGYMGTFQAMTVIPLAIGPVLGGFLAEGLGWRSVFWFLAIYGGICLVVIAAFLPETLRKLVGDGSIPAQGLAKWPFGKWCQNNTHENTSTSKGYTPPPVQIDLLVWIRILGSKKALLAIIFSSLHYTGWQMVLTALPSVFEQKYGFSSGKIGLVYISNGVGAVVGTFLTGQLLNIDYARMKRSTNGQVREETRLRTVWIWSLMQCFGLLMFGWSAEKHFHVAIPILSLLLLGWAPVAIQGTVSTYLVDVFDTQSASATASMNFCRCLMGAGGSAAIGPLISGIGLGWAVSLIAIVTVLTLATGTLMYILRVSRSNEKTEVVRKSARELIENK